MEVLEEVLPVFQVLLPQIKERVQQEPEVHLMQLMVMVVEVAEVV